MRTDAEILKEVNHLLDKDPALDTSDIAVQVNEGIITLTGTVHTDSEKWMARNAVRHISGVKDVVEKLSLRDIEEEEK